MFRVTRRPRMGYGRNYGEAMERLKAMILRIPPNMDFEEAWDKYTFMDFNYNTRETQKDIEKIFNHTRAIGNPPQKMLTKKGVTWKFIVSFSIQRCPFDDVLCDTGACMNVMTREKAYALGLWEIYPTNLSVRFADASTPTILGIAYNLNVQIGNTFITTDFLIMKDLEAGVTILGRPFLATAVAVLDIPNGKMVLTTVDRDNKLMEN